MCIILQQKVKAHSMHLLIDGFLNNLSLKKITTKITIKKYKNQIL
jgi:hypothetical protein